MSPYGLNALDEPTPVVLEGLLSQYLGLTSELILKLEWPRIISGGDFLYF